MISILSLIVFSAFDSTAYIMDEIGGNNILHFYSNLFSYAGINIALITFAYYISEKIRENCSFSKKHDTIILIACIFDVCFIILGSYTGKLFKIVDQHTVYGPWVDYIGISQTLVCMYLLIQVFFHRKSLEKKFIYTVSFYFILPMIIAILEFINPKLGFVYMISSIIFLIVYLVIVREDLHASMIREKISYETALADKRLYSSKAAFYKQKGMDRRGQFEAHVALCNLYTKILKVNLTNDTYQIVNMDTDEQKDDKGYANTISDWLIGCGKTGQVHKDDLDEYLQKTNIDYLREYFKKENKSISIFYRRKYVNGYKQVVMEMIPTGNYENNNQELFLYVKSIDK